MWDVEPDYTAELFNGGLQEDYGGGSIHVVVAIEQNRFVGCDRALDPRYRGIHAEHVNRIMQVRSVWIQKSEGVSGGGDSTRNEKLGENLWQMRGSC